MSTLLSIGKNPPHGSIPGEIHPMLDLQVLDFQHYVGVERVREDILFEVRLKGPGWVSSLLQLTNVVREGSIIGEVMYYSRILVRR